MQPRTTTNVCFLKTELRKIANTCQNFQISADVAASAGAACHAGDVRTNTQLRPAGGSAAQRFRAPEWSGRRMPILLALLWSFGKCALCRSTHAAGLHEPRAEGDGKGDRLPGRRFRGSADAIRRTQTIPTVATSSGKVKRLLPRWRETFFSPRSSQLAPCRSLARRWGRSAFPSASPRRRQAAPESQLVARRTNSSCSSLL